tara:strand:+ start:1317 stop:1619 length:303 start_codon:yes stop_codon:yes gene_type:complete
MTPIAESTRAFGRGNAKEKSLWKLKNTKLVEPLALIWSPHARAFAQKICWMVRTARRLAECPAQRLALRVWALLLRAKMLHGVWTLRITTAPRTYSLFEA